jgi:integrase
MHSLKTRQGKANLNRTDKNTYVVNIPANVAKGVYKKNRKRIALYLSADSNESMSTALSRLDKIQAFLDTEDWQGLVDYEESLKPKVVQGIFAKQSLKWLWDEYLKVKRDSFEVSYLENDIKQASRLIAKAPKISLTDDGANEMFNYLMGVTTVKQTKRYLKQFSACLTWAKRRRIVKDNPYPDLIKTISTKRKNEDEKDINPFSIEERDLIIDAFRTAKFERYAGSHLKYADYIEFNFLTGARTNETLGLKWSHIDFKNNQINFQEGRVMATNGSYGKGIQKKGLKTQKSRLFPMNSRISNLLLNRKDIVQPSSLEDNVFANINHSSFRGNQYAAVLKKLEIDYRKPYQTRHTFITIMANESDLKLHQIAQICGTSINIIEDHYLSNTSGIGCLPEI